MAQKIVNAIRGRRTDGILGRDMAQLMRMVEGEGLYENVREVEQGIERE